VKVKGFRSFFDCCLKVGLIVLFLLNLAGYFGHLHRYFELTLHFKLQYFVLFICASLLFAGLRQWPWVVFGIFNVLLTGYSIIPWYISDLDSTGLKNETPLRLVVSNVRALNEKHGPLIKFIQEKQPDIVVLEEINKNWLGALNALDSKFSHKEIYTREDNFGIAVYSQRPFVKTELIFLGLVKTPSVLVTLGVPGKMFSLLATHLLPPVSDQYFLYRNDQLDAIGAFLSNKKMPLILAGDLNLTMWSPYYVKFCKNVGFKNVRKGFGILPTWPAHFPMLMIPIDHCLVSQKILIANRR